MGCSYRDGRGADAGKQHYVVQLSCLPDRAFPNQHPVDRGGLRLFLEPLFGDFHLVSHRRRAKDFGTTGVFVFIAAAMLIVMAVIGLMGPRTRNLALEEISR